MQTDIKNSKEYYFIEALSSFHRKLSEEEINEIINPDSKDGIALLKAIYDAMQTYADQKTAALREEIERLRELLAESVSVIKEWHGRSMPELGKKTLWEIYRDNEFKMRNLKEFDK